MIDFPNAKINLGLNILGKREDGYHELSTCFYPLPWKEVIEIIPSPGQHTSLNVTGIPVPGDPRENLCLKAFHLLKMDFDLPELDIALHKMIPPGSGLGGGSADGAFTLKMLSRMFNLFLDDHLLAWYAARLGSDSPFFIYNKPLLATGRGEIFDEIKLDLSGKRIIVLYPGFAISTQEAFRSAKVSKPEIPLKEILENHPVGDWKQLLTNDFENTIFPTYPVLKDIKTRLYEAGSEYASLSGSGSSVFGLFENQKPEIPRLPDNCQVWIGTL